MSYSQTFLPEFDCEMGSTRKVLERVPEDNWNWRAHSKSNTIGWNANHLADLPGWSVSIVTEPGFDFAPVGGERYQNSPATNDQAASIDEMPLASPVFLVVPRTAINASPP